VKEAGVNSTDGDIIDTIAADEIGDFDLRANVIFADLFVFFGIPWISWYLRADGRAWRVCAAARADRRGSRSARWALDESCEGRSHAAEPEPIRTPTPEGHHLAWCHDRIRRDGRVPVADRRRRRRRA
jgi:hypothetical protein